MTTDFLIGAIRASRDLHPLVKTVLEDILRKAEQEGGHDEGQTDDGKE